MTNDILRLRDALVRDSEDNKFREDLDKRSASIKTTLGSEGVYRLQTPKGTIVIRSTRESA